MREQSLEYKLIRNHLHEGKTFMPRAINQKTVRFEKVLREMERNTAIRSADLQLAMNQFMNTMADILARGMKAETPIGTFSVVLQGRFDSLDEEFSPDSSDTNHKIRLQWVPSTAMKKDVARELVIVKNMDNMHPVPNAVSIENVTKPERNEYISKEVISIRGMNLKINTDDEEQGLFWIDSGQSSFKNITIVDIKPSKLVLQVPELPPGIYDLEIRDRFMGESLRHTTLFGDLTVCAN